MLKMIKIVCVICVLFSFGCLEDEYYKTYPGHITLNVTNQITDEHMEQLIHAVKYLEKKLNMPDLFHIYLKDTGTCEDWDEHIRTICLYEVSVDNDDVSFGHAKWTNLGTYKNQQWSGRIKVKPIDFSLETYQILYLHEISHILRLEHTPNLTDNAMGPSVGRAKFYLHPWQIDVIHKTLAM